MKKYNFTHDSKYVKKLVDEDFYNVQSYQELDDKIAALSHEESNWHEGMAFELFIEALANVEWEWLKGYLHHSKISKEIKDEWSFPIAKKKEYGIDAIAYEGNSSIPIPIQIKFQSKKKKIIWEKLKSLFAAAQKFPYGRRLIIHNQVEVDDALPKDSYSSIGREELHNLEPEVFERVNKWLKGTPVEKLKTELEYRDYQDDECVPQVREELTTEDRTIIHAVQGSGKTVMVIKCILDLLKAAILKPNMNAVILVPNRYLIYRWLNPILRWIPAAKVLPICTPEEVATKEGTIISSVTDVTDVAKWLKENDDKGISICVVTVNSYPVLAQAVKLSGVNKLDLGCADECHNYTGYLRQRKTFFLQNSILKIDKRIAASGTFLVRAAKANFTGAIASMDDPLFFGNVAFSYRRARALKEGMICGHRVWYSVSITEDDIDEGGVEFEGDIYRADWTSNLLACKRFVEGEDRDVKNCIVLHNRLAPSKGFASDSPVGIKHHMKNVWTGCVNSEMSLNEKAAVIKDFEQARSKGFERAFLCLVGCGLEGMDIPIANGIWFAAPKKSEITIDQVTHRIARTYEGKRISDIGMPLHLKSLEREDVMNAGIRTGFEKVLRRYDAMDENDFDGTVSLIQEEPTTRKKGWKRDKDGEDIGAEFILPDGTPNHVVEQLKESIRIWQRRRAIGGWYVFYEELIAFKEEHGHTVVPIRDAFRYGGKRTRKNKEAHALYTRFFPCNDAKYFDSPLASWVSRQRSSVRGTARRGEAMITDEQIELLNKIGFAWNVDDVIWEKNFEVAKRYYDKDKSFSFRKWRVPLKQSDEHYVDKEYKRISLWCNTQRVKYTKNKLGQWKIEKLQQIEFLFDTKEYEQRIWQDNLNKLKKFKEEQGHTDVPQAHHDQTFMAWFKKQKVKYNAGKLTQKEIKDLETVGIEWSNPFDRVWENHYKKLEECYKKHGHCQIEFLDGHGCHKSNPNLSRAFKGWLVKMRKQYKRTNGKGWASPSGSSDGKSPLTEQRIDRLNKIGFIWDSMKQQQWDRSFAELLQYRETHGDVWPKQNLAPNPVTGINLGTWCNIQRQQWVKKKLPEDRFNLLESIGFLWAKDDAVWMEKYLEVKDFKEKHGYIHKNSGDNLRSHANGKQRGASLRPMLTSWVTNQKKIHRNNTPPKASFHMSREKQKRLLEGIGVNLHEDIYETYWQDKYEKLKKIFVENHGKLPASLIAVTVGRSWATKQRQLRKDGKLPKKKMELLDNLGFDWNPKQRNTSLKIVEVTYKKSGSKGYRIKLGKERTGEGQKKKDVIKEFSRREEAEKALAFYQQKMAEGEWQARKLKEMKVPK